MNIARGSQSPVARAMMLWIDRHGPRVRNRNTNQDSIDIADELNLTTHQMLRLENAMREFIEGRWFSVEPGIAGQRTLFNPRVFSKIMPHGKITVEGPVKSILGKRYRWYVYIHMSDWRGRLRPVAAGIDASYKKAQDEALKAYLKFARPKTRMLFNPPRGHKLRAVFEQFRKEWEKDAPAIFLTEEHRERAKGEAEILAQDIAAEHQMSYYNLDLLWDTVYKYIDERERKEKQRRHPTLFNAGTR